MSMWFFKIHIKKNRQIRPVYHGLINAYASRAGRILLLTFVDFIAGPVAPFSIQRPKDIDL